MSIQECKKKAEETVAVESDKFDRHMRRARESDMSSRQDIFIIQSEQSIERRTRNGCIQSSLY